MHVPMLVGELHAQSGGIVVQVRLALLEQSLHGLEAQLVGSLVADLRHDPTSPHAHVRSVAVLFEPLDPHRQALRPQDAEVSPLEEHRLHTVMAGVERYPQGPRRELRGLPMEPVVDLVPRRGVRHLLTADARHTPLGLDAQIAGVAVETEQLHLVVIVHGESERAAAQPEGLHLVVASVELNYHVRSLHLWQVFRTIRQALLREGAGVRGPHLLLAYLRDLPVELDVQLLGMAVWLEVVYLECRSP
mmetsp:Transcript_18078/g.48494  ORF Transcript_18078/g.48494 Transcript_18078/m.48494 type:complete len:247 (+) Transcript_18078:677-1417(+)